MSFNDASRYEADVNIADLISSAVRPNLTFENGGPIEFTRFTNLIVKLRIPLSIMCPKVCQGISKLFLSDASEQSSSKSSGNSDSRLSTAYVRNLKNWEPLEHANS